METLEQKKRRLLGKKYLRSYLEELSRLLNRNVKGDELLSIEDTDAFIRETASLKNGIYYKKTIKFEDKVYLKNILEKNVSDFDKPYFMYLSYSLDCGLMKFSSLRDFNLNFNFYDEHVGLIEFIRSDEMEEILLDYYEENGEKLIDIEIFKKN